MAMLITLFTHEHNAICDRLKASYPTWGDEELFQRARLVNAALLAKIHTVEWTPAVISHPTTVTALRANWFGLAGERVHRLFGRISASEVVSGIPGGEADQYGVPYALTEEFAAVYRMHPLIRDDWSLRKAKDDSKLREEPYTFTELTGPSALEVITSFSMTDLLYSFGTLPPGVVELHNYPLHMQEFARPDGRLVDLAATDIVRSREMGIPRYNEFRRLLHLEPFSSFEEMTDKPEWAREISEVYGGDIEKVDLQVGHVRREAAGGLRVQRHGVPDLRADGVPPAQQRPLLHRVLHARRLHRARPGVDRGQLDEDRPAPPPPRAAARAQRGAQRVRGVAPERLIGDVPPRGCGPAFPPPVTACAVTIQCYYVPVVNNTE